MLATTAQSTEEIPGLVDDAFAAALAPHGGPAFVDFPMDYVFMEAPEPVVRAGRGRPRRRRPGRARGDAGAEQPRSRRRACCCQRPSAR